MSNISNRHRVVLISTGPIGPKGDTGVSGSSQPFSEISNNTWSTQNNIQITGSLTVSGSSTFKNIGPTILSGSVNISGSVQATRFIGDGNGITNLSVQPSVNALNAFTSSVVSKTTFNTFTASAVLKTTFNAFTSSYQVDSSSFAQRINAINIGTGFVTTAIFNTFTSSVNTRINNINAKTGSIASLNTATGSILTTLSNIQALTASIISLNDTTASLLTVVRYEADSGSFNDQIGAVLTLAQNNQTDLSDYITSNNDAVSQLGNTLTLVEQDISDIQNDYVTSTELSNATVLSSSFAFTASYIDPLYISASAAFYGFGSGGGTGDITGVTAGLGLSGSATSGNATITLNTASIHFQKGVSASAASYGFGSGGGDTSNLVTKSTFNTFTGSIYSWTSSIDSAIPNFAVLDNSNNFNGTQTINGTLHGNVEAVNEDTQSIIDCSLGNFFTLDLRNGTTTTIAITNISAGQTVNLKITMGGGNTVNLGNNILEPSASPYSPSQGVSEVDILTFISFDGSDVYMSYVTNMV